MRQRISLLDRIRLNNTSKRSISRRFCIPRTTRYSHFPYISVWNWPISTQRCIDFSFVSAVSSKINRRWIDYWITAFISFLSLFLSWNVIVLAFSFSVKIDLCSRHRSGNSICLWLIKFLPWKFLIWRICYFCNKLVWVWSFNSGIQSWVLLILAAETSILRNAVFWFWRWILSLLRSYAWRSFLLNEICESLNFFVDVYFSLPSFYSFSRFRLSFWEISLVKFINLGITIAKCLVVTFELKDYFKLRVPSWFNSQNFSDWNYSSSSYNLWSEL